MKNRDGKVRQTSKIWKCPYGIPGDRLWVRETWAQDSARIIHFQADGAERPPDEYLTNGTPIQTKWQSPIFMPRWASRITLEITDIRAEKLQKITYEDILAEGWDVKTSLPITNGTAGEDARAWYRELWDSLNGKKYLWASNPWVWVIKFKRPSAIEILEKGSLPGSGE